MEKIKVFQKIVLILILLFWLPFFGQNENPVKFTKIDALLDGLGAFITMSDKDIPFPKKCY